jgi:MFS transporter, ACDE family, multidrug resistance protein
MQSMGGGNKNKRPTKIYRDHNLQIVFSITLMAVLGVSSISPAFPAIERELGVSTQDIGLLITFFTVPGVLLTPLLGVLGDRVGRRKVLVPSLMLFGVAGTACAFVRDFDSLLALRFIQGVGAASLGALNVTIIGDLYSGRDRTAAFGYNASVLSVGTAGYPLIGGALAALGWYYPFALPVLAVPIALLVLFSLKNPEPRSDQLLKDYLSGAWQSIKNRQVIGLFIAGVMTFMILYGSYLTYFPFLLGYKFEASSLLIGMFMSGQSLSTAIASSQLGRLSRSFSEVTLLKAGYFLYALALGLIPFAPDIWTLLIPTIIFGVAIGINIPSIFSLLTGLAPMKHRAAFMSINGMVLRLGQTIGPILVGAIFAIWGISGAFYVGAAMSITMVIVLAIVLE